MTTATRTRCRRSTRRATDTLTVDATGTFEWHINPSRQPGGDPKAWTLTCGTRARRQIYIERDQAVNVGLTCGPRAAVPPRRHADDDAGHADDADDRCAAPTCQTPNGFRSVDVRRRGSGLRIAFSRLVTNGVTVDIFQTSKGRKIINGKRVKRYTNQSRSFTWNGRATGNKRLSDGVYYVRVRILDANKRIDSRRVVVERKNGRFIKRGGFYLDASCG